MMRGKKVFVTGGAGVIGQELVPKLCARGAIVMVGDLKPKPELFPAAVSYWRGDLTTISQQELDSFAPQVIIHLAATFERSQESASFWEENFHHNVALSHHIMTLATQCATLERVVFASSYLVYEPDLYQFQAPQNRPVSLVETDRISPRNLVGMAKLSHEAELRFLAGFAETRFTSVSARITRGYGRNSRDVVSRWVRAAIRGEPLSVYRPEGMFDYIYAADSAEGLIRLAENPSLSGAVNLGTGRAESVSSVVQILKAEFPSLTLVMESSSIGYEASQADITLLFNMTGWSPAYSLERGILEIIDHEKGLARV